MGPVCAVLLCLGCLPWFQAPGYRRSGKPGIVLALYQVDWHVLADHDAWDGSVDRFSTGWGNLGITNHLPLIIGVDLQLSVCPRYRTMGPASENGVVKRTFPACLTVIGSALFVSRLFTLNHSTV